MKEYELTLISQSNLQEEELNSLLQGLSSFIQDKEGILEKQDVKRNVQLPAPIQKHVVGTLATLKFQLAETAVEDLAKKAKEHKGVLRTFLTIFKKPKVMKVPTFTPRPAPVHVSEEPKMTTEEIDKQLEEIFKDKNV